MHEKYLMLQNYDTNNIKWRNGRHCENIQVSWRFLFIIKKSYWNNLKLRKITKNGFNGMIFGTLGEIWLGNTLTGPKVDRAGNGIIRTGYGYLKNKGF